MRPPRVGALVAEPGRGCRRVVAASLVVATAAGACGTAAVNEVADGTYLSRVPSAAQVGLDTAGELPGGSVVLREGGIDRIEVDIDAGIVTFRSDGTDTAELRVIDRLEITDREGSGPFSAEKQILVLGDMALVLGPLTIEEPVIWPGSFDGSPVITIKSRDSAERGPVVSCDADELCLLLSSGVDPRGRYEEADDPSLDDNPIESILIDDEQIRLTLDSGTDVSIPASSDGSTVACGLSENPVWDLPASLGLAIDDPVLVHTLCPSPPGAAVQLMIMERAAIPLLAPLSEERDGDWCAPGPACLRFVPT